MPQNDTLQNFSADDLIGTTVTDTTGDKIGKVDDVYLDNSSDRPEWVSVKTGLFGSNVSLIPLSRASFSGDTITVPFEKSLVKDAPHHDPGTALTESDENELYRYYDTSGSDDLASSTGSVADVAPPATAGTATGTVAGDSFDTTVGNSAGNSMGDSVDDTSTVRGAGHDTSGPDTDGAMTRSKEELHVGTETREAGRARLRKYVTTERVSQSVPVSHEEVVLEREPITDANVGNALSGGDFTEEEHEVVLTEERAVAATEAVPVERVRLGTETVQGTETVEADLREEHIDLDTDAGVKLGATDRGDRA